MLGIPIFMTKMSCEKCCFGHNVEINVDVGTSTSQQRPLCAFNLIMEFKS